MYGWRTRVGLAVPSVNTVMESELSTHTPEGVSIVAGRMRSFGDLTVENLSVINEDVEQSATLLAPADVDVIVYGLGMTPASVVEGESHDVTVQQRIESVADVTGIASSGSLRRAFDVLGVDRIAALTPYTDEINAHLREHAADGWGYPVVATAGWRITEGVNIGNPTPEQTYRQAQAVDHPDADTVVVGGTNQRSFEVIDRLERDLGKPVVTANQATLWDVLRQTDVDYSDIELGRLFKQ